MKNIRIITLLLLITIVNITIEAKHIEKIKLNQYLQVLSDNNKFMGNVSIFSNGIEIYSKSVGYADIDHKIPNSELSKTCVGSISKTFTAVMIFKNIEAGKLSLDETLDKYFPSIPNSEKITIGQLLAHRTGIHNFTNDWGFMQWSAKTRDEMIKIIADGGSDFEPDSTSDYSNSNYVLLSYILEEIFEKPYAKILANEITLPLSLQNTYFGKEAIDINNSECNSYKYSDKWEIQTVTNPFVTMGAGCIISTSKDLNIFVDALFNGKLISDKSLLDMLTIRDGAGLGIYPASYFSKESYGHRGGIDGFNSMYIYLPEDNISYAITSNGLNYNFVEMHAVILNCIYGQEFDIPNFKKVKLKSNILKSYEGIYTNNHLSLEVTISEKNNSLFAQITGQPIISLEATSKHAFRFVDDDMTLIFNTRDKTIIFIQGEDVCYLKKE